MQPAPQRPLFRLGRLGVGALLIAAWLAGCSGSTGPTGPAAATGANPVSGVPPVGAAGIITTATSITGTITGVTIAGTPVVHFTLVGENNQPLTGLPAADLGVAIAKLVPGQNGGSSQWVSYIYSTVTPGACPTGVPACATTPKVQASVESATSGALVDHGDGTYQYTFAKNITTDPNVAYVATLTHRVAFEIRGLAQANNGSYTFQPSSGATSGIFSREITNTAACDSCHTSLTAHGGARVEVQYCVMCHNPGTSDPASGNTLDMTVMIHKIHTGSTLPSIQTASGPNTTPLLGSGYWIVGYGDSLSNFNTVLYPQDTRNCATSCHVQTVPALTDAADYKTVPTMAACGACHDNVNFATGANHAANLIANDTQCVTCHGTTSTIDNGTLQVVAAHTIPTVVAAAQFRFIVNGVTFTHDNAGNIYPVVRFSVVNPSSGNAPYNILTAQPFAGVDPGTGQPVCANGGTARLGIDFAWDNLDYTNFGSGNTASTWGQPLTLNPLAVAGCAAAVPATNLSGPDAAGVFTVTSNIPLPPAPATRCPPGAAACAPVTNLSVVLEGHPGVVTTGPGATAIPVTSAVAYAAITGGPVVARRVVVDVTKCDTCHGVLVFHGDNRNDNPQVCVACHNPASTDVGSRQTLVAAGIDGLWEQTIDFKVMIHAIHDGSARSAAGAPFVVYGYGGSVHNFNSVVYPGQLNDCEGCHLTGTYYPVNDSAVQATTLLTGLSKQPANPVAVGSPVSTSANMAICSSCHVDPLSYSHMLQMGGQTAVLKDAEGRTIPSLPGTPTETCALCHGAGGVADVVVVHNVSVSGN